ncbi:MAG TPA: HepT-like ribonuclease domain-containing protein [Microvirga sp.]|nr:HepT-like ribonuclease domain-containing protein [Microvirga sp.]
MSRLPTRPGCRTDVPWPHLRGLRNRLAHAYFAVDAAMVYLTASTDIPRLLQVLARCEDAES